MTGIHTLPVFFRVCIIQLIWIRSFLLTYGEITPSEQLSDFRVEIFKQDSNLVLFDEIFTSSGNERYFSKNFKIKEIIEKTGNSY